MKLSFEIYVKKKIIKVYLSQLPTMQIIEVDDVSYLYANS